jgi:ParB-like chromosome segregation protein Spo0J
MEQHPITEMEAHPLADLVDAAIAAGCPTGAIELPDHPITDMEVHPLADAFPEMSEAALSTLAADIKKNGLLLPIVTYKGQILDGRHRYKACKIAGVEPRFEEYAGDDLAAAVESFNGNRRHLTMADRKKAAAKILAWHPEMSDRAIAKEVGLSDKTLAQVRKDGEARSEIPHVETRSDSKGRAQPAAKPKKAKKPAGEPKPATEAPQAAEPPKPPAEPSASANPPVDVLLDTFHQRAPADQVAVMQLFWDVLSPWQRQQIAPKHEASEAHPSEVPTLEHFEAFWERASRELRNEVAKLVQAKVAEARKRQVDEMVKGAMHPVAP